MDQSSADAFARVDPVRREAVELAISAMRAGMGHVGEAQYLLDLAKEIEKYIRAQ